MKSERKNITQPQDWWAAFEVQAKSEGLTLSEWIGECCKTNLEKKASKDLSQRPAAHRPEKSNG